MDKRVAKLNNRLGDLDLAERLVEAGYDTPRKVKAAKKADLVKAIGRSKAERARTKLGV